MSLDKDALLIWLLHLVAPFPPTFSIQHLTCPMYGVLNMDKAGDWEEDPANLIISDYSSVVLLRRKGRRVGREKRGAIGWGCYA